VRTAYLDMESAYYRLQTAHQEIAYARENYRINKLRYDEKLARSTEVNDSLVLLKQAAFNYYTALFEYHTASARLARITGKNLLQYAVTVQERKTH